MIRTVFIVFSLAFSAYSYSLPICYPNMEGNVMAEAGDLYTCKKGEWVKITTKNEDKRGKVFSKDKVEIGFISPLLPDEYSLDSFPLVLKNGLITIVNMFTGEIKGKMKGIKASSSSSREVTEVDYTRYEGCRYESIDCSGECLSTGPIEEDYRADFAHLEPSYKIERTDKTVKIIKIFSNETVCNERCSSVWIQSRSMDDLKTGKCISKESNTETQFDSAMKYWSTQSSTLIELHEYPIPSPLRFRL